MEDKFGYMLWKAVLEKNPDIIELQQRALAHYMFREIIEDAHAEYNISQEDMEKMNRKAANRAKLFLEKISQDKGLMLAFAVESAMTDKWDKPVITEEEEIRLGFYKEIAGYIDTDAAL